MVKLDSVLDWILIIIIATAQSAADAVTNSAPVSMATRPGRRIISIPTNPKQIALHRWMRKRSPSTRTARMAMKIGAVKPRAVTLAIGEIDSAVKNINIAAMLITPRSACNPICFVRRIVNLERIKSGKRKAKPKTLRKKAI